MTKYRYMVVQEGVIDAEDAKDAEERALVLTDGGFAQVTTVQVDELREGGKTE